MEVRWSASDPDGVAAWLAPFQLADGRIAVERTPNPRVPDHLTIVDLEPSPPSDATSASQFALVAVGIATVDWERFARDARWSLEPAAADEQLGAFAWSVMAQPLVLLEPRTEGRLAATLARVGEGPAALYLGVIRDTLGQAQADLRARGVSLSSAGDGPLGREVLVLGRPASGPHVLLVDRPATIAP